MSELFRAGPWRAVEMTAADAPALQAFFDANPEYFLAVNGEPARPGEAAETIAALPPEGFPYTRRWMLRYAHEDEPFVAVADVVSDLLAESVGHIGLFIVATRLHGTGAADTMYHALERWMAGQGARWLRLGVVAGNRRAEGFWTSLGYVEARRRGPMPMGRKSNTVRVLVKPLAGGSMEEYLALVPRDRPEPP